jgi:hypothetical protein
MSESEKPFTVSDRRHFTPDGRRKDDDAEREGPREPVAAAPPSSVSAEVGSEDEEAPAVEPSASVPPGPTPSGPADFGQFLISLAAQASLLLVGQGLPGGTDPAEALEGAQSIIAVLEMLREKTEGRRTARESEILEGLLFELRMAYVEKSRTSGT